jgi:hypothetical protein
LSSVSRVHTLESNPQRRTNIQFSLNKYCFFFSSVRSLSCLDFKPDLKPATFWPNYNRCHCHEIYLSSSRSFYRSYPTRFYHCTGQKKEEYKNYWQGELPKGKSWMMSRIYYFESYKDRKMVQQSLMVTSSSHIYMQAVMKWRFWNFHEAWPSHDVSLVSLYIGFMCST